MNISSLLGFIAALGIFIGSSVMAMENSDILFQAQAILIVVGGTAAVTLVSFPYQILYSLTKVFFRRIFGKTHYDYLGIVEQIKTVSTNSRRGKKYLESTIDSIENPFLKEATQVMFWLDAEVTLEDLRMALETRAETFYHRYTSQANMFRTISKFPPAFGLMGTTIGMIALLQGLGGSKDNIGPAMAIALVTTLWGLALANFVFIPIAENLEKQTEDDLVARRMIVEGVLLIAADKPTKYVEEVVRGFLLPSERGEGHASDGHGDSIKRVA